MNIFLTGGSGGIGKEVIRAFLSDKANYVFYTYYHNAPEENSSEAVKAFQCDLSSLEDVRRLIDELKDIEFDVIINNAFPKLEMQQFHKTEWKDVQGNMDVGVRASFELTKAFSRAMKKRKSGYVVNILSASVLGESPKQMMPYVIAKYALLGFHNALASEFKESGIKVYAVSPHMVKTDFLSELSDHYIAMTEESLPGKKLLDPAEIAEKVRFLVSDEETNANGINVPILESTVR